MTDSCCLRAQAPALARAASSDTVDDPPELHTRLCERFARHRGCAELLSQARADVVSSSMRPCFNAADVASLHHVIICLWRTCRLL